MAWTWSYGAGGVYRAPLIYVPPRLAGFGPEVTVPINPDQTIDVDVITATASILAPQVDRTVDVGSINATASILAPQVDRTIDVAIINATASIVAPASVDQTIDVAVINGTATILAPSVTTPGANQTIDVAVITATASILAPQVDRTIDVPAIAASASILSLLQIDQTVDVPAISATASILAPSLGEPPDSLPLLARWAITGELDAVWTPTDTFDAKWTPTASLKARIAMTKENQDFILYATDDKVLDFTVKDADDAVVDITSATAARFLLDPATASENITKTLAAGGITIPVGTDGVLRVTLDSADTDNTYIGRGRYEVELTMGGDVYTVATGEVNIKTALLT